jgi:hypothetical protein
MSRNRIVGIIAMSVGSLLGVGVALSLFGIQAEQNQLPPDVVAILNGGDSFMLLSLEPLAVASASQDIFHGHAVLGRAEIHDAGQRRHLLQALYGGIANAEEKIARCWSPRHGLRVFRGNEVVDLVICFECLHLYWHFRGSGLVLTNRSPEITFLNALESAGLKRPGMPK